MYAEKRDKTGLDYHLGPGSHESGGGLVSERALGGIDDASPVCIPVTGKSEWGPSAWACPRRSSFLSSSPSSPSCLGPPLPSLAPRVWSSRHKVSLAATQKSCLNLLLHDQFLSHSRVTMGFASVLRDVAGVKEQAPWAVPRSVAPPLTPYTLSDCVWVAYVP